MLEPKPFRTEEPVLFRNSVVKLKSLFYHLSQQEADKNTNKIIKYKGFHKETSKVSVVLYFAV